MAKKDCGCAFGAMCKPECFEAANQTIRNRRIERLIATGRWKPLHSIALACHPSDALKFAKDSAKKGVPTDFDKEGCPVFTSRQHRARYLRAYGYFDKDAGYGDPVPETTGPTLKEIAAKRERRAARMRELGIVAGNVGLDQNHAMRNAMLRRQMERARNR